MTGCGFNHGGRGGGKGFGINGWVLFWGFWFVMIMGTIGEYMKAPP